MKVILLQEVEGLGKPGDIKEVANGYARNYLLPRQLVTAATGTQLANLRQRVASTQRRLEKQRQTNATLAERLSGVTLTFAVRVGQGGRLYGSVTNQNIADALREQESLTIDRRTIQLRDPIRQLGEFGIGVRVAQGVEPKVKVRVVATDDIAAATATPATPSTHRVQASTETPTGTPAGMATEASTEASTEEGTTEETPTA
jgi:large subunit ribosomal protein L9